MKKQCCPPPITTKLGTHVYTTNTHPLPKFYRMQRRMDMYRVEKVDFWSFVAKNHFFGNGDWIGQRERCSCIISRRNQSLDAKKIGVSGSNREIWTTRTRMATPVGYQNGSFLANEDELPTQIPRSLDGFRCGLTRETRSCSRRSEIRAVTGSKIWKYGCKMYFLTDNFCNCAGCRNVFQAHYSLKDAQ